MASQSTQPPVAMRSFSYRYPGAEAQALREVELELGEGELVVLAGRSGSGKSTLLRACCGLIPHYHGGEVAGSLSVCGRDVREHGPAELGGLVGLVGQDPERQVVSATVRGELELPLELRGEPPAARARALEEVLLALAIPHLAERPTDALSGGELQRVALAAALVLRPRLVLLDEPTSQLDPVAGDELIGLLRRLNEEWGMAVVLAEHRLERCLAAADRVVAVDDGRVAFEGSPHAFGDWALEADPALATPGARLFSLVGLRPLPVAAKEARRTLRERGLLTADRPSREDRAPGTERRGPRPAHRARRHAGAPALLARDLWIELDPGGGSRDVLRRLELAIEPGERVALMGRNGAGKSTLLRAAAGLLGAARGRIEAPRGCALLPQSPTDLFLRERVRDELPGAAGARALAAVGLAWASDRDPRDLSGGERERLALAIVMAGRADGEMPGIVCLDEPTRGMDGARKASLSAWLGELARDGSAVLVATHDVEFASRFAARVVMLGAGETIADGPVDEILSGGWYFATEVARILDGDGAITPEQGARVLRQAHAGNSDEVAPRAATAPGGDSDEVAVYPPTTCRPSTERDPSGADAKRSIPAELFPRKSPP
jgi:energy-coupling factor transport system ATP-binding protein